MKVENFKKKLTNSKKAGKREKMNQRKERKNR